MISNKLKIPLFAKSSSRKGLFLVNGLSKDNVNVKKAVKIITEDYVYYSDMRLMSETYLKLREKKTKKCQKTLLLLGGRRFLRSYVLPFYKKNGEEEK